MLNSFYGLEMRAEDALFQHEKPLSDNIRIIGIDTKSLTEMGAFNTWTRADMADLITVLNQDEETRPAVIGVDIMYFGETDETADSYLAYAAGEYGNVVTASLVNFDSKVEEDDKGNFYLNNSHISKYEEPFDELKNNTVQGHVNTVLSKDGLVRDSIQKIDVDGEEVNSFAYEVYKKYKEFLGDNAYEVKDDTWHIAYSGKPGSFYDGYSFVDILDGNIDLSNFAGKIVLVGPYTTGLSDDYSTPIDYDTKMFGVEIHANVINALLNEDFKTYAPLPVQLILMIITLIVLYIVFYKLKIKQSLPILIISIALYLGVAYLAYQGGHILRVIYLPAFLVLLYVIILAIKYIATLIEKKKVEGTFKRYVAPQVVEQIMNTGMDKIELGGKNVDIAVLFVDIRGFTPLSEALKPEEVVEVLNEYFDLITGCIFKNGGTLDKYIGDAAMAIFNAPVEVEDYTYKAVQTAIDIVKGAKDLEEKLYARFNKKVSFGVGVNKGEAVVGNIGTAARMDYTAIGNTVNTAARLEANAKAGHVLISDVVYNEVKDRIKAESIGNIPLKGKSEEIEVFDVILE
ncbi:MAG: adenylate/guanylate cyclase domain-containing protein [Clostridia bacterium]|nr:adenylate/guanylate cyclase domain-containing protein [Clostridia bacterium]